MRIRGKSYSRYILDMSTMDLAKKFISAPIKLNKSKGAPWWKPGSDRSNGLVLALLSRKIDDFSNLTDWCMRYGDDYPLHMMMLKRTQAQRKPVPWRAVRFGSIVQMGQTRGPKTRTVKAPPFVYNNKVAPIFELMKDAAIESCYPRHLTRNSDIVSLASSYRYLFSSDLSTADDTVSLETLEMWRECIYVPFLDALVTKGILTEAERKFALDYDRYVAEADIYAPARTLDEQACILRMTGGIKSGYRGTTQQGIDIFGSRCDAIVHELYTQGIKATYVSWGDDVMVMSNDERAKTAWANNDQRSLWKEEIDVGPSMLSKYMPYGYGFFMRYIARRLNREPHEEPQDMIGAALALKASELGLVDTPSGIAHPLAAYYYDVIHDCFPSYRPAISLAQSTSLIDLMVTYNGSYTISVESRFDAGRGDDDEFTDLEEYRQLKTAPPTKSKLFGVPLAVSMTEGDIRSITSLVSMQDIRRWVNVKN